MQEPWTGNQVPTSNLSEDMVQEMYKSYMSYMSISVMQLLLVTTWAGSCPFLLSAVCNRLLVELKPFFSIGRLFLPRHYVRRSADVGCHGIRYNLSSDATAEWKCTIHPRLVAATKQPSLVAIGMK